MFGNYTANISVCPKCPEKFNPAPLPKENYRVETKSNPDLQQAEFQLILHLLLLKLLLSEAFWLSQIVYLT
ncbi:hypothetical protein CEXT_304671 [Caerostris extrusa]|uniref:Uncharacterized protein n=1 Tax=Caerostris extrusa TaxID=172846 RepID=A0AAV4MKE1_CAEEX|nr:hypothetical protein CEXT_304671 [Caerostris extrusa]